MPHHFLTLGELQKALYEHILAHPDYIYVCDDNPTTKNIGFSAIQGSECLDTWTMPMDLFKREARRINVEGTLEVRRLILRQLIDVAHRAPPPEPPLSRSLWERLDDDYDDT